MATSKKWKTSLYFMLMLAGLFLPLYLNGQLALLEKEAAPYTERQKADTAKEKQEEKDDIADVSPEEIISKLDSDAQKTKSWFSRERDNLLNFLLDPVVICLYFFLHPVVPVLVPEIYDLGQLLVVGSFPFHLLVIHHNFRMEYFCSILSSKLSLTAPTNIPCVKLDILLGGIKLSICVLIEVDLSFRLIVMLWRFCKTFPKRSESVFAVSETT